MHLPCRSDRDMAQMSNRLVQQRAVYCGRQRDLGLGPGPLLQLRSQQKLHGLLAYPDALSAAFGPEAKH
jgi:hypothetical protein